MKITFLCHQFWNYKSAGLLYKITFNGFSKINWHHKEYENSKSIVFLFFIVQKSAFFYFINLYKLKEQGFVGKEVKISICSYMIYFTLVSWALTNHKKATISFLKGIIWKSWKTCFFFTYFGPTGKIMTLQKIWHIICNLDWCKLLLCQISSI